MHVSLHYEHTCRRGDSLTFPFFAFFPFSLFALSQDVPHGAAAAELQRNSEVSGSDMFDRNEYEVYDVYFMKNSFC